MRQKNVLQFTMACAGLLICSLWLEKGVPVSELESEEIHIAEELSEKMYTPIQIVGPSRPHSPIRLDYYQEFFHKQLIRNPDVAYFYHSTKKLLSNSPTSELIAIYVAEGATRNTSTEFHYFLTSLHESMAFQSNDIYAEILFFEDELKEDPFAYQMVLNLTKELSLKPEQEAEIRGIASKMEVEN